MDADAAAESLSVTETNALRVKLGLRPLYAAASAASSSTTEATHVNPRALAAAAATASAVTQRLDKSRREREEMALVGRSVVSAEDVRESAADWVASMRRSAATGPPAAATAATASTAPARTGLTAAASATGLRVAHAVDAFAEGETVVLTLRDTGLLDETAQGLADGEDELVNVNLVDSERTQVLLGRKRTAGDSGRTYAAAAAAMEADVGSGSATLLSKYDHDEAPRKATLRVEADGLVREQAGEQATRQRLQIAMSEKRVFVNLGGGGVSLASSSATATASADYLTKEEASALFAPARKKKNNLRRARSDEVEEGIEGGGGGGVDKTDISMTGSMLVSELQRQTSSTASTNDFAHVDRGSRARRGEGGGISSVVGGGNTTTATTVTTAAVGDFTVLVSAAQAAAAAVASTAGPRQRVYERLRTVDRDDVNVDEDDADLQVTLSRARRLAQLAAAERGDDTRGGGGGGVVTTDHAANLVANFVATHQSVAPATLMSSTGGEAAESSSINGGGMIINDATEFSHLLQTRQNTSINGGDMKTRVDSLVTATTSESVTADATAATAATVTTTAVAVPVGVEPPLSRKRKHWKEFTANAAAQVPGIEETTSSWVIEESGGGAGAGAGAGSREKEGRIEGEYEDSEGDNSEAEEEEEEEEEGADAIMGGGRPIVGVAGALALFAQSGALSKKEEYAGRANDKRLTTDEGDESGIKLDYRDELGRKLTPKEAYRRISYAFHGRDPSKSSRDKRMKRMLKEQALKTTTASTDTPLGILGAQQKAQEARGSAYLPLSKL